MYEFSHSWPFEWVMDDLYVEECPFCGERSVLLTVKKENIKLAQEGFKTHAVMPCCHEKLIIVNMDDDYIWSDRPLRNL